MLHTVVGSAYSKGPIQNNYVVVLVKSKDVSCQFNLAEKNLNAIPYCLFAIDVISALVNIFSQLKDKFSIEFYMVEST